MIYKTENIVTGSIEYKVIYSSRRTLGISVMTDSTVIVRVPYHTARKTIMRMVEEKSAWIIRHRDNFINHHMDKPVRSYMNGSSHLFRGSAYILNISESRRKFVKFNGASIDIGIEKTCDETSVRRLLQKGYKTEATACIPVIFKSILEKYENHNFKPTGLVIRSMKRRWGSCSNSGKITLSTELIKLADIYTEYVIIHELCHLKQHNHGPKYYKLLSELFPEWKKVRKEMRGFVREGYT
jgi:predicted metal-dependent hydrolase